MNLPFWFLWIIGVLATYRLAYLTTTDTGPFAVFARVRGWVGERYGFDSWQYEGAQCPLCQGIWFAGAFALLLFPWLGVAAQFVLWLSMAGGAALLQNLHWWLAAQVLAIRQHEEHLRRVERSARQTVLDRRK